MVYDRLLETNDDSERYSALFILGLTKQTRYRNSVEVFLAWPQYPLVTAMAIKVLCRYWSLMNDYIDRIMDILKGISWDLGDDCRLAAIQVCGQYLANNSCPRLLQELLRIFNDTLSNPVLRGAAYEQMCVALGISRKEVPFVSQRMVEQGRIDQTIIERINGRLAIELK